MADRERRSTPAVIVGDGLLLLCALLGLTDSFLSLYGSPDASWRDAGALDRCAANAPLFLAWAAVFALLALAVFSLPRFRWAAAGALWALWAGAAALNWRSLVQGAGITVRDISVLFSRRVSWGREFLYDPGLTGTEEAANLRMFLLLALAGLALLLGWAVARARRWWLVLALTLPPLLPGLLADLYPDWPGFMALAACWCVMLLTALCKWAAPDRRGKLTLAVFPAVALALALITLAFPREGYTRPPWALKAHEDLMNLASRTSDFFSRWDGPFGGSITYVGAAEEADLAHAGPLNYFGRTVLRVNSDYDGRLYLRGSSLAVYENGVWTALPQGTYEEYCPPGEYAASPLYFPAMLEQDGPTYTVTVNNVGAVGACVYAPYFPIPQVSEDTGALPVEDAYFARKQGQWSHTLSFVDREPPSGDNTVHVVVGVAEGTYIGGFGPSDGQTAAAQYAGYAYDHYLDIPAELRETLDELVGQALAYPAALTEEAVTCYQLEYAQRVAAWMEANFEYDPETPAAPEGADPVLYFLNESRRGYCMHYASAATLMLRSMGVPARYVSGFTVESVPGRQVDVPDRAAHAWVEVWVDGFGWYPVEVTPAAAFTWYEQGTVAPDDVPATPPPESEVPEPTPTPTPSQAPDTEAPEQPSAGPQGPVGGDGPQGGGGSGFTIPPWLVKALAIPAAIAALLWLAQFALKRSRAKRMAGPDANRAALVCYGYLCRLERWGGRMDGRAVELAQKARFSQHTLTEEELALLRRLVDRERTRLCVAPGLPQRLVFRCLWGMPRPPMSLAEEE